MLSGESWRPVVWEIPTVRRLTQTSGAKSEGMLLYINFIHRNRQSQSLLWDMVRFSVTGDQTKKLSPLLKSRIIQPWLRWGSFWAKRLFEKCSVQSKCAYWGVLMTTRTSYGIAMKWRLINAPVGSPLTLERIYQQITSMCWWCARAATLKPGS